ncbi:hypothetical protein CLOSCI_01420 [[Clostridium] scindens ATCC 35704]|nr:hypothetical protein CLOSCI_01420 [[Clostridium] scindens ATCC 35704]
MLLQGRAYDGALFPPWTPGHLLIARGPKPLSQLWRPYFWIRAEYWQYAAGYIHSEASVKFVSLWTVFCKHFLEKNAKYFWRMLHLQIGESCKASAGSYSASYIAIADHI